MKTIESLEDYIDMLMTYIYCLFLAVRLGRESDVARNVEQRLQPLWASDEFNKSLLAAAHWLIQNKTVERETFHVVLTERRAENTKAENKSKKVAKRISRRYFLIKQALT